MPVPVPPNAKRVFKGVLFDVWQWEQEQFDGSRTLFECETRQDTVTVIGFLDAETVLLTHQEQSGRTPFLDFPGGRVDQGETHEQTARREFLEETGLVIGRLWPCSYLEHRGSTRFAQTVFVAAGLQNHTKERHLDPGERIEIRPTKWSEAIRVCLRHELRQAEVMLTVLSLAYDPEAKRRLENFLSHEHNLNHS